MAEADHTTAYDAPQRKGRHRVIESCLPCHRQKRGCDRKRPCSHCVRKCIAGQCVYEAPRLLEASAESENEALRVRVAELETALESYKAEERNPSRKRRRMQDSPRPNLAEGVYYGRSYYLGGAAAPELLRRMLSLTPNDQSDLLFAFSGASDSDHVDSCGDYMFPTLFSATMTKRDLLDPLSKLTRAEADKMLDAYFEIVDPLHHYAPTPWIDTIYEKCWSGKVDADELALIYAVLALGDLVSSNTQSWFSISISMQLLRISNFLSRPTLNCIFTFAYIGVYQQHEGKLGQYWPVLGLVLRLCQSMALHRDPELVLSVSKEEAELRRRAFWTVAAQETAVSSMFGRPNAIGAVDCKLPADISDDELFGHSFSPNAEAGNEISYNLLTWQLSLMTKDILNSYEQGKGKSASDLTDMEQRVEQWLGSLPPGFSSDAYTPSADTLSSSEGRKRYAQKLCIRLIAKHDILLLYRKAVLEGTILGARKPCFEAAFDMSDCWRELQDRFPRMARVTWMHWSRAFHAALMCLIAIQTEVQHSQVHSQATACWLSFLRIFDRIKDQNPSIRSCSRALNRLDAVLKTKTGMKVHRSTATLHKQIQDTSARLLVLGNGNEQPVATGSIAQTPPPQADAAGVATSTAGTTASEAPFAFEPTPSAFEALLEPQDSLSEPTSSSVQQSGTTLHPSMAIDAFDLFDLDIQNWPSWLTNDESPDLRDLASSFNASGDV